jgi:hypothetical protein
MARTSNFANVATVTRASTKTDAGGWDFTSGGTVGTLTEYASGVAAIHSTAGLLVEESTTNEIRNPRCEGATTGTLDTTGALPTNWATAGLATSEWTVNGTGTEDGWPYIELSYSGSDTSADIYFEGNTQVSAMTGETWAGHVGVKLVSGSLANTTIRLRWQDLSGAGSQLGVGNFEITPTSSHLRFFQTRTTAGGGTQAYVRVGLQFAHSAASAYTIRVYAPQLEEKAYPTSPVFPVVSSPATTTRARDQVSIALPSSFFSSDGATVYVDMTAGPERDDSARQVPWAWYLSGSRRLYPYIINPGNEWRLFAWDGADIIPSTTGYVLSSGLSRHRMAVYLSDANIKWAVNGAGGSTENYSITPTATLAIGDYTSFIIGSSLNTRCLNGYIKDLRYWPKELSNAEMAALVGL